MADGGLVEFEDIWFASENRHRRRSGVIAYDDVGRLDVTPLEAHFAGRKHSLTLHGLEPPELVAHTLAYRNYLWLTLVSPLPFVLLYYVVFGFGSGFPLAVLWVVFVSLEWLAGVFSARKMKWVRLTGTTDSGERASCYFADGRRRGWPGLLGGTERIFDALVHA